LVFFFSPLPHPSKTKFADTENYKQSPFTADKRFYFTSQPRLLRYYAKYKEFLEERDGRLQYAAAIAAQSAASATSAHADAGIVMAGTGGKHLNESSSSSRRRSSSSFSFNRLMVGGGGGSSVGGNNLAQFLKFDQRGIAQHDPVAPRNKAKLDEWLEDDSEEEDLKMSAIPSLFWRPKVSFVVL
jgi:hypothetical protein